jgi:2-(1,2-epoxy-1,2-dihydrophenyl)acetyl-CoA isomerase
MAYTAAGLSPDGSATWLLPRLIGMRRSQELMLTNRTLSAKEAEAWGLVTRVVPDAELAAEAKKLAQQLAAGPTRAYGVVKSLLAESASTAYEAQLEHEARGISSMAGSADGQEGIRAFVEKRAARFSGR